MVTIVVEGRECEVKEGQNLLEAVLNLGYDLPYFCWHPALGSVGACRQCAVKQYRDEKDTAGMIIMACMTPVSDGLRISIDDPEAVDFRSSVIEWLMTNHPHDCPVCDEGGECHLQDMTVMSGHNYREHRFNKRTYLNQDLGPFLNHEMNRCIQCYRCVRFYRDYAGGEDFNVFGSRNRVYFGRVEDGTLESPFSGNLAEVCPTGVFTDKTFKRHSTRKWDLQTAPSVCMLCGLGCNTLPGERYGELRRIRNRYHGDVNGYFLCDRGRFGYEFVNSSRRLREPMIREPGGSGAAPVQADRTIEHVASLLGNDGRTIGIGSPTASLEANHALKRLVGSENFYGGMDPRETEGLRTVLEILSDGGIRTPSIDDVTHTDAVLILGEDLTNTAPLLDLAVRQASLNQPKDRVRELDIPDWNDAVVRLVVNGACGPLYLATPAETDLDGLATRTARAAPPNIAQLGFAIANLIDPEAPTAGRLPYEIARLVGAAAEALQDAEAPLVIAGMGAGDPATLRAAANVVRALSADNPSVALCLVVPHCNSVGLGMLGGADLQDAASLDLGEDDTLIVLENDLFRRGGLNGLSEMLDRAGHIVVLDHLEDELTERAEVVLPAATFAESGGTVVNNEARAQRFLQVFVPEGDVRASWRWLKEIGGRAGDTEMAAWSSPDDAAHSLAEAVPALGALREFAARPQPASVSGRVPRQSHRFSGRTAINAHRQVKEAKPPDDTESELAFTMEGGPAPPPASLITRYWAPGWNSVQALNKFQEEIGGPLRGGNPGLKLIGSSKSSDRAYFTDLPEVFTSKPDVWLLVPLHHLYGSEPLSLETPGVADQAPAPYLALHPEDAASLGAGEGDALGVEMNDRGFELPIKIKPDLARGCVGVPLGLTGLPTWVDRQWVKLSRLS